MRAARMAKNDLTITYKSRQVGFPLAHTGIIGTHERPEHYYPSNCSNQSIGYLPHATISLTAFDRIQAKTVVSNAR